MEETKKQAPNTKQDAAAGAPVLAAEEISKQIKPLSQNAFAAFFQRIWRAWLSVWYGFSDKHPKGSKLIYQIVLFVLFSQGVTIFQFLLFLFLPQLFGQGLAEVDWLLPRVLMGSKDGVDYFFSILGKPLAYKDGAIVIGGGLGYFLAFLIATFLAQCINFPLQRNITFRSHGNVAWQLMWYFIGWILIQPFCDMIGSVWKGLVGLYLGNWPVFVMTLLDTIIMGGISMLIFFFVFLIIFPDYNAVEKRACAKVEKLKAANAGPEKIAAAEAALAEAELKASVSNTEKAMAKTKTQANAKAIAYFATEKNLEKSKQAAATESDQAKLEKAKADVTKYEAMLIERQTAASEAVAAKDKAKAEYEEAFATAEKAGLQLVKAKE